MRFFAPFVATILLACGSNSDPIPVDLANEIYSARRMFNGDLLRALDHRAKQTNVIVSPYGIHSALSSLLSGANGKTYQELWDALGYKFTKLDADSFLDANKLTLKNVTELHDFGLSFANLLAVEQKLPLKQSFENAMTNDFGAAVKKEDFINQPGVATKNINDWVRATTNGKIEKLFDENLSSDTRAVVANTIHFKSGWLSSFSEANTFVDKFHLANGSTKEVTFMKIPSHRLKNSRWSQNFGFSNVQIPFDAEGRLWFGIQIPDGHGQNMDCCTPFTHFIHNTHDMPVTLTIPKFAIAQAHNAIKEILQEMGVKALFDQASADLSKIDGEHDLFVSKISHKATFSIDEKGAEGAAATGVVVETKSLHLPDPNAIPVTVNAPFIFSISDRHSNVDLFTGIIYDPTL